MISYPCECSTRTVMSPDREDFVIVPVCKYSASGYFQHCEFCDCDFCPHVTDAEGSAEAVVRTVEDTCGPFGLNNNERRVNVPAVQDKPEVEKVCQYENWSDSSQEPETSNWKDGDYAPSMEIDSECVRGQENVQQAVQEIEPELSPEAKAIHKASLVSKGFLSERAWCVTQDPSKAPEGSIQTASYSTFPPIAFSMFERAGGRSSRR